MNKCLNCGKELQQTEGKRQRKFCDNKNKCKQEYHNKNKPKEPKYVQFKSFKDLKERFDAVVAENNELKQGSLIEKIEPIVSAQIGVMAKIDEVRLRQLAKNTTKNGTPKEEKKADNSNLTEWEKIRRKKLGL